MSIIRSLRAGHILNRLALLALAGAVGAVQADGQTMEFEAASLKRMPDGDKSLAIIAGGPGTPTPRRVRYSNIDLRKLIADAYGVQTDQVVGPGWLVSDRYALEAVLPASAGKEDFRAMFRSLLVQRFGLEEHREKREFQVYNLVVEPGGAKLRPAIPAEGDGDSGGDPPGYLPRTVKLDAEACPVRTPGSRGMVGGVNGRGCQTFRGTTLQEFAHNLSTMQAYEDGSRFGPGGVPAHVNDMTGLSGEYDFELRYNFLGRIHMWNPEQPKIGDEGPSLAEALKTLGLRLRKEKDWLEVVVIDRISRMPAEN